MVRTRIVSFVGIGVLALGVVAGTLWLAGCERLSPSLPGDKEHHGEAYENVGKRSTWELMRLRDPATGRIPDGIRRAEAAFAAGLPRRSTALLKRAGLADYGWTWRGPHNVGGRTRALAYDVDNENTLLAGGVSGGMWRSTDAGLTWTRTTLLSYMPSVSCIAQDVRPGKHNVWYYGSGEVLGASASENGAYYTGNGLFKSTDNGLSWAPIAGTASNTPHTFDNIYDFVWRVVIDPSNTAQDELYMATYGAIARSTDGGTTWRNVRINTSRFSSMNDVAVTDSGVVYATLSSDGGLGGIWRSVNGTTWVKISPPDMPATFNRVVIGIAPSNQNVVYFLSETPGTGYAGLNFKKDTNWSSLWKYTYVSGDGTGAGGVWENRTANLPSFGGSFGDFNPQSSYNLHVTVKPDDENAVFIGGTNLYRSTNGFTSPGSSAWIGGYRDIELDSAVRLELEYPEHHPDQHFMLFSRTNPSRAYTASDGGVHVTTDALAPVVQWRSLGNGYGTSQFYTIGIDHATAGSNMIVGGLQDNGTWLTTTLDVKAPWNWIGSGDGSFCAVADGAASVYVSKQEGKAYRVLLDGEGKLANFTRIDPLGGGNYLFINPFALNPANTNMMFLSAGNQLWRNSDLTQIPLQGTAPATVNWTRLAGAAVSAQQHITAIGISQANPAHRVYYGTDSGLVFRLDGADTGDPAPVQVTGANFPKKAYIGCIAVDPLNADRAVVVFTNYSVQSVFLTTDGGTSWAPISGNLEATANGNGAGPSCRWFSFLHRGGGTVYLIGTSTGLYSTTSLNGTSTVWALEGAETIGNVVVDMIEVRQSDGYVVVGTHGTGIYSTTIGLMGVDDAPAPSRIALELAAPVPNPVRGMASLSFTAPVSGDARLELFDAAGRSVGVVYDDRVARGTHRVALNAYVYPLAALPQGTYYCRLSLAGASAGQPLVLVR